MTQSGLCLLLLLESGLNNKTFMSDLNVPAVLFQVQGIMIMASERKRIIEDDSTLLVGSDSDTHITEDRLFSHESDSEKEDRERHYMQWHDTMQSQPVGL
jgi:hypothetical protein